MGQSIIKFKKMGVYHNIKKKKTINTNITAENLVSPLSLSNFYTSSISFLLFSLNKKNPTNSQYEST